MRSGKGGPVLVEIPAEVWEADHANKLDYAPVPIQRAAPDPIAIKQAAHALLAANNPLLWAGQGVIYAEASDLLATLAELVPAQLPKTIPLRSAPQRVHDRRCLPSLCLELTWS